jgi:ion channel-forming bestrophin family protein
MIVGNRGSIWGLLVWQWKAVVLFASCATVAVVLHKIAGLGWVKLPSIPIAVVGGALGIFVSFRTNAAYARWWEGRQLWGRLINLSRMFATQVLTYVSDSSKHRALIERHILYVNVLRCLLREQDPWADAEVQRFAGDFPRAADSNLTHAIIHTQLAALVAEADAGKLRDLRLDAFDRTINGLLDVQGGCERIKRTPMPRLYGLLSEQLTKAFGILFPFAVVAELGWATIPLNILVCTGFMMISEVGRILEDPFTMFWNGLPLSALSRTIENNLRQRLGDTALEPMLQPNDRGVLM